VSSSIRFIAEGESITGIIVEHSSANRSFQLSTDDSIERFYFDEIKRAQRIAKNKDILHPLPSSDMPADAKKDVVSLNVLKSNIETKPRSPDSTITVWRSDEILSTAKMMFTGNLDLISAPEPKFVISQDVVDKNIMTKDDINEIRNKSKSRYDYALKSNELSRIKAIIDTAKEIEKRYEASRISNLSQLCGLLLLKQNPTVNLSLSYEYLNKSLQWQPNDPISLQGIIFITMRQNKWKEAGEYLLRLLLDQENVSESQENIVRALGRCLCNIQNGTLPGLLALKDKMVSSQNYFNYLIFLAIVKESPEAAILVYDGKYTDAQKLIPDSVAFQSAGMLYPNLPPTDPIVEPSINVVNENYNILTGNVIFYPDRKHGFINSLARNESFFFVLDVVEDSELRNAFLSGVQNINVSFEDTGYRPIYARYNNAKNVSFASEFERERVRESKSFIHQRAPLDIRLASLPKDNSLYAQAKKAEQLGDLDTAEKKYNKIIMENRNTGREASSVLDLASMYSRQDKYREALKLIGDYRSRYFTVADNDRLDNVQVSILIKAKQYERAAELLKQMLDRTPKIRTNTPKFSIWFQQRAFCFMMMAFEKRDQNILQKELVLIQKQLSTWKGVEKVTNALRVIDNMPEKLAGLLNPQNPDVEEEINEAVTDALEPTETDEIQLPIVAEFLLKNNKLENFDQRIRDTLDTDKRDDRSTKAIRQEIDRLREQLKDVRGKRPLQKYHTNLSIAYLYWKYPDLCKGNEIRDHLYRALSFFGEGYVYEQERELARISLADALSIHTGLPISFGFGILLISYLQKIPETSVIVEQQQGPENFLEYAIDLLDQDEYGCEQFAKDFPYFMCRFYDKSKELMKNIKAKERKCFDLYFKDDFEPQRKAMQKIIRDEKNKLETTLRSDYKSLNILAENYANLRSLNDDMRFTIDKERIDRLAVLAERFPEIDKQTTYLLSQRELNETATAVETIYKEIKDKPTALSLQYFYPLLDKLNDELRKLHNKKLENSASKLTVVNLLANDNYVLDENNHVQLHLKIKLTEGTAPVEALEVIVEKQEGLDFDQATGMSPDILFDGTSRNLQLVLIPSQQHIEREAFDVQLAIGYTVSHSGERKQTEHHIFPVRLGEPGEPIENPYNITGAPISDPKKFVGRSVVIQEILTQIKQAALGKCYALYGQKRCGKSSTLKAIQRKLTNPCLAVYTDASSGEAEGSRSMNFAIMIRESLRKVLSKELTGNEMDLTFFKDFQTFFPDATLMNSPVQMFSTMIDYAKEKLKQAGWSEPRIILLIDEFTYIYQNIISGKMDGGIMRHWKAMLQNEGFSAVLVGQDTMPWFMEEFANEFGVVEKKRISYLSKDEFRQLADDWILLPNDKTRYRDTAFDRLFEYTAGNPYYSQRFCYTLVEYLNRRRASIITEADVDMVAMLLCRGGDGFEKIVPSDFHPFYEPLNQVKFSNVQYIDILRQIAARRNWAAKQDIGSESLAEEQVNEIIDELLRREILVQRPQSDEIKINVMLYAQYLWTNR